MRSMSVTCLLNVIAMAIPAPKTLQLPVIEGQFAPAAEPSTANKFNSIIQDQADSKNDIIVTANSPVQDRNIRDTVQSITREVAFNKPLARYNDPICVEIIGLRENYSKQIKDRMIFDAKDNGVETDKENCKVNVAVLFVDNPQEEAKNIFKKKPQMFDAYSTKEIKNLINDVDSVKVIHSILTKSRDGEPIKDGVIKSSDASTISLPIRRDILSSVALVNIKAITGLTIKQISDYLVFRTLTNSTEPKIFKGISIIELFLKNDAGNMPQELTKFDKNYIKTLYSGNGNVRSVIKTGQITRNVINATK